MQVAGVGQVSSVIENDCTLVGAMSSGGGALSTDPSYLDNNAVPVNSVQAVNFFDGFGSPIAGLQLKFYKGETLYFGSNVGAASATLFFIDT